LISFLSIFYFCHTLLPIADAFTSPHFLAFIIFSLRHFIAISFFYVLLAFPALPLPLLPFAAIYSPTWDSSIQFRTLPGGCLPGFT